jgi:hypothetical protein
MKRKTTGPDWFDLPAPAEADLPSLHREVEALRLRNHLDPKRFYRKEEGEGKGIKGLPKHFAVSRTMVTQLVLCFKPQLFEDWNNCCYGQAFRRSQRRESTPKCS